MIQLETRKVTLAGITRRPMEEGLIKVARNLTDAEAEPIWDSAYRLHDRDTKFCNRFPSILREVGVEPLRLPRRSPN
jgi:putative transposase